jgi:hypothetical protein
MQPQPTTETQPRDRRALSNLKHGLTGRIYLFGEAEQAAYDNLCRGIHESLAPEGAMEAELVKAIADDRWRLQRAATLESSIFAEAAEKFAAGSAEATGDAELDVALSEGRTWIAEARNLNLLTLYESRIQRRFEKNMAELRRLQAERKAALEQAIEEAAILSQLAQSKGEAYDPAEAFTRRGFEFSPNEIARMIDRRRRLFEAKRFSLSPRKVHRMAA